MPGETLGTSTNFDTFDWLFNNCPEEGGYSTKFHTRRLRPEVQPLPFDRLRAVSLFSWSVEQNARDTQMVTPSFLAGVHSPTKSEEKERLLAVYISDRKGTPFVYLPLTNSTPFTYLHCSLELCIPYNCCKYTVFTKPDNFHDFFPAMSFFCSPFRSFYRSKWQISLTFQILQQVKSLPFHTPGA